MENSPPKESGGNTYTYDSPHPIYAMAFSPSSASTRLALGSFIESPDNRIDIVSLDPSSKFTPSLSFDHPYPPTKLLFHPSDPSLLASSADSLRLWHLNPPNSSSADLRALLNNAKASDFSAPLTSFDWNPADPRRLATCSIDTTCTVWDLDRAAVDTQLIAHDKEVYDIAWGGPRTFASVSADASLRIFDLRDKEHSTILYESHTPLLRLAWNRSDPTYMATILMDTSTVVVLDIRAPSAPVAELNRHRASVNALAWAPTASTHLCSAGDDGQALIWDLPPAAPPDGIDPVLAYSAPAEINQLQWSAGQPDWIGIAFANKVQLLRV